MSDLLKDWLQELLQSSKARVFVSAKNIIFEVFLSNLVFIGIESEIQRERIWVEGKGIITIFYTCGWDGDI
jgi:hypothetical protein